MDTSDYGRIPPHMMAALRAWVASGDVEPGDFLRAVLSNDLCRAVEKADSQNMEMAVPGAALSRAPKYHRLGWDAVGLPAEPVFTLSNSERKTAACALRWWFDYAEGLKGAKAPPLRYGTAWHSVIEDVHRWWMAHDALYPVDGAIRCVWCNALGSCLVCGGGGLGPALRARVQFFAEQTEPGEAETMYETLIRAAQGWLFWYGNAPYQDWRVVGVEVVLARPIVDPVSSQPFRPRMFVTQLADGKVRHAKTGEAVGAVELPAGARVREVRWPWYALGVLDAVLQHRRTGRLLACELKSSGQPAAFCDGLSIDPQTTGYAWLLRWAAGLGHYGQHDGRAPDVQGYQYDVASSHMQRDPEVLKSGELSRAKGNTPSWRYTAALMAHGLPAAPYMDHVTKLTRDVDPKLYLREHGSVGDEAVLRYGAEIWGVAHRHADLRRATATAHHDADIAQRFPRTDVCRSSGGSCPFRGPCLSDGADVRRGYTTRDDAKYELTAREISVRPGNPSEATVEDPW